MNRLLGLLLLLLLPVGTLGFACCNKHVILPPPLSMDEESLVHHPNRPPPTNVGRIMNAVLPVAMAGLLALACESPAWADDEPVASPTMSISACRKSPTGGPTNCVSTRNVKQLDLYAPPWTFESAPEEAAARIKGVVATDPNLELLVEQEGKWFQIKATRGGGIFSDSLELLINPLDKVVTFRAEQEGEPSVSDFGAIRKELESIRQRGQFGVMGQNIGAADAMPSQNGPLGQLKAFYGLQSGQGFEEVFEEH